MADSGKNGVYFRPYQNTDFKNSLTEDTVISKLTPKSKKENLAHPGGFELLSSQTCINTCVSRKLHYGVVKHKSLFHTEVQLCRHTHACSERVDSCMQLAKAFNIQPLLLPQHHMHHLRFIRQAPDPERATSLHFDTFPLASPMHSTNGRASCHLKLLSGLT